MNEHFPSLDNDTNTKKDSSTHDEKTDGLNINKASNNEDMEELKVNKEFQKIGYNVSSP